MYSKSTVIDLVNKPVSMGKGPAAVRSNAPVAATKPKPRTASAAKAQARQPQLGAYTLCICIAYLCRAHPGRLRCSRT